MDLYTNITSLIPEKCHSWIESSREGESSFRQFINLFTDYLSPCTKSEKDPCTVTCKYETFPTLDCPTTLKTNEKLQVTFNPDEQWARASKHALRGLSDRCETLSHGYQEACCLLTGKRHLNSCRGAGEHFRISDDPFMKRAKNKIPDSFSSGMKRSIDQITQKCPSDGLSAWNWTGVALGTGGTLFSAYKAVKEVHKLWSKQSGSKLKLAAYTVSSLACATIGINSYFPSE